MVRVAPALSVALSLALIGTTCSAARSSATEDTAIASSTTSTATSSPSTTTSTASTGHGDGEHVPSPAAWRPCGHLECTTVAVPLDYDQPDGPSIRIAMTRRPASGPRRGAIFVNPGGPGGSGVDFITNGFALDGDTMASYDLIGFDPRGVGASHPVSCDLDRSQGPLPDFSPDNQIESRALDDEAAAFARACEASDGELLAHLRTDSVVRDLDVLRQAVGDDQLHYYGFSFGTLIGLVYAQRFPDRVGHMVLDGVVDPTHDLVELLTQQAVAFEAAFAVLDAACSTELTCPPGGAAKAHDQLLARLELDGPVGQVGPAELEAAGLITLYSRGAWPRYVEGLAQGLDGDFAIIESLSDSFTTTVNFGSYAGVECSDGPHPAGPAEWDRFTADVVKLAPRFGAAVANELRTCAFWPVAPGPARPAVTASGAASILVIGNTNDPATPLLNARKVADTLAQASLVVAQVDGHTAYSSSICVQSLVSRYFVDDASPPPDTRC